MTDKTKLVGAYLACRLDKPIKLAETFRAMRVEVLIGPQNWEIDKQFFIGLGLVPRVCGCQSGKLVIRMLVPESSYEAFEEQLKAFGGGLLDCKSMRLMCPTGVAKVA